MAIARFEPVVINTVTNGISTVGTQTTTITPWFDSRARIKDVHNSVRISDRYRIYSDLVNLEFNYTPNMRTVVNLQQNYSKNQLLFQYNSVFLWELVLNSG